MDVREKLVELISDSLWSIEIACRSTPDIDPASTIAANLISHGVTVQEWISVADELPKKQGFYRVYHKNSKSICDRFYHKDCPDLFVNVRDDPITHWKPIEQPPKGEQNNE